MSILQTFDNEMYFYSNKVDLFKLDNLQLRIPLHKRELKTYRNIKILIVEVFI